MRSRERSPGAERVRKAKAVGRGKAKTIDCLLVLCLSQDTMSNESRCQRQRVVVAALCCSSLLVALLKACAPSLGRSPPPTSCPALFSAVASLAAAAAVRVSKVVASRTDAMMGGQQRGWTRALQQQQQPDVVLGRPLFFRHAQDQATGMRACKQARKSRASRALWKARDESCHQRGKTGER